MPPCLGCAGPSPLSPSPLCTPLPPLFHLNTEIVTKRDLSACWLWLLRELLLYFEGSLEGFGRPFRSFKNTDSHTEWKLREVPGWLDQLICNDAWEGEMQRLCCQIQCWISSTNIFSSTGKYYKISSDYCLVPRFFLVSKSFQISPDFQNLVECFTIWQHCCWVFQCLVNKLFIFSHIMPIIRNDPALSNTYYTQIHSLDSWLLWNASLLREKFHETFMLLACKADDGFL